MAATRRSCDASTGALVERQVMYFGAHRGDDGLCARWQCDGDEPGSRAHRTDGRKMGRTRLAARAGDDEDPSVVSLVRIRFSADG